jgi:cobalt-zinc-cadmium efflux system membrane fusion protein
MKADVTAWSLGSLAVLTSTACTRVAPLVTAAEPVVPAGEIWLTAAQVADARIEVVPVREEDVNDTILVAGTVALDDERTGHVFSPVTGRVVQILAPLGTRVKKGDALAIIESPDIGSALSDVAKGQADLIAAEHDLRRRKDLYEQKAEPAADVEASEDNYRKAKAELERAQEKDSLLRLGNADAVTQRYTLVAPIDGEVLARNINPGTEVQGQYGGGTSSELFTVGEIGTVWVLGSVYEMDLARVHLGSPAVVTVVAYPDEEFKGQVDWVSGSLDPNTRTATVRCTFDNPDRHLRPMMYATAQISVEKERITAIPRNALLRLGAAKVVFTQVGESAGHLHFRRTTVDVDEGASSPWLAVKGGLSPGEKVVVNGAILLSSME